jgi:hypothetical protein
LFPFEFLSFTFLSSIFLHFSFISICLSFPSYPIAAEAISPRVKRPVRAHAEIRNTGAVPPLPHTSSCYSP